MLEIPKLYLKLQKQPLESLHHTRRKMDILFRDGRIAKRDLERVYEGLYLRAITYFENYIETLFFALLCGKILNAPRRIQPKLVLSSEKLARQIVFGGKSYLDWLPYSKSIERAKVFFRDGIPFSKEARITTADVKRIDDYVIIRNYIAHRSSHSEQQFIQNIINGTSLLPRNRTPCGYLSQVFRTAPDQTRFELFIIELLDFAKKVSLL